MGSIRIGGIRFVVYSDDHLPRHVHCFLEGTEVVIDLLPNETVALAGRRDAIRPCNAKASTIKKVLISAAANYERLAELWEGIHGETN